MASDFEKESVALANAVHGRPVAFSDVKDNLTYTKAETGSANHKLGANPAWWLDCQRRGDTATVLKGLDWCGWYSEQPLYENESGCVHAPYRVRMDQGTYALAMLAHFANQPDLRDALLARNRLSVGLALFGAFSGNAKKLVNDNPKPPSKATLLIADGPLLPLEGNDGTLPWLAGAGMRSKVRSGAHFDGPISGLNDGHLRVLVAQALGYPYRKQTYEHQADHFDTIRQRTGMLPWGLSAEDVADGRAFLKVKSRANALTVFQWLTSAPVPKLPYVVVQRASGAVEFVQMRSQNSSTGALQCEVVLPNGTRYLGSADNGMRGGENSSQNIQPQTTDETAEEWVCRWISGQGTDIHVPRPPQSDAVTWRLEIKDGEAHLLLDGTTPAPEPPEPPEPGPEPPMQGAPLVYLGRTGVPGEYLYGSHDPNLTLREIHGDAAFPKRWIAE